LKKGDFKRTGHSKGLSAQEFKELMQLDAIAEELEECLNSKATD